MAMKDNVTDIGSISEWNEGNFKNLRLHEAQELINIGKVSPFSISENGSVFNFNLWKDGIDILYGEGSSKYSDNEIVESNNIKKFVEIKIKTNPPFKKVSYYDIEGKKNKLISNTDNQELIRELLELYEQKIRKLNDEHGLSTRNKEIYDIKKAVVSN